MRAICWCAQSALEKKDRNAQRMRQGRGFIGPLHSRSGVWVATLRRKQWPIWTGIRNATPSRWATPRTRADPQAEANFGELGGLTRAETLNDELAQRFFVAAPPRSRFLCCRSTRGLFLFSAKQILRRSEDQNALDCLPQISAEMRDITGDEVGCFRLDGAQENRSVLLR